MYPDSNNLVPVLHQTEEHSPLPGLGRLPCPLCSIPLPPSVPPGPGSPLYLGTEPSQVLIFIHPCLPLCLLLNLEQCKFIQLLVLKARNGGNCSLTVFKSKRLTGKGSHDGKGSMYPTYEAPFKTDLSALNGAHGDE